MTGMCAVCLLHSVFITFLCVGGSSSFFTVKGYHGVHNFLIFSVLKEANANKIGLVKAEEVHL